MLNFTIFDKSTAIVEEMCGTKDHYYNQKIACWLVLQIAALINSIQPTLETNNLYRQLNWRLILTNKIAYYPKYIFFIPRKIFV